MASIIYTPSHDVSIPDNGPLFGAHTVVAEVSVANSGNSAGNVQMYISPQRDQVAGTVDRQTVPAGGNVALRASYTVGATTGIKQLWAVVTDDASPPNELAAHRFSDTISQRRPQLAVQGHISINVG